MLRPQTTHFNFRSRVCYQFLSLVGEALIQLNMMAHSQFTNALNFTLLNFFFTYVDSQARHSNIANRETKKRRCHICPRK